jgi:hypothetical protein
VSVEAWVVGTRNGGVIGHATPSSLERDEPFQPPVVRRKGEERRLMDALFRVG